jgi:Ca2+-binding EF-hand superfamily protein
VESFYFRDKGKTGYLTIEELQGASAEAIKAASRSHDNRLTLDEYLNAVFKDFAAADTDGDGKLTFEEIDLYIRSNRK